MSFSINIIYLLLSSNNYKFTNKNFTLVLHIVILYLIPSQLSIEAKILINNNSFCYLNTIGISSNFLD